MPNKKVHKPNSRPQRGPMVGTVYFINGKQYFYRRNQREGILLGNIFGEPLYGFFIKIPARYSN